MLTKVKRRHSASDSRLAEAFRKKTQDTLDRLMRRLALAIDEADGQHTVRRLGLRLCRRGGKLNSLESVAELAAQSRERRASARPLELKLN